jgi:hypothetical protein
MKQVRTAKGRIIDMAALAKTNESDRAVTPGNVKMNGRGDRLDVSGNVVQTVQATARAQHNTTSAPEKRKLSDAPTAPKKSTSKKPTPEEAPAEVFETRREEKERADGTRYLEIEFEDGSMDVKEL